MPAIVFAVQLVLAIETQLLVAELLVEALERPRPPIVDCDEAAVLLLVLLH